MNRIIEGTLYASSTTKVSSKGNEYALFAISQKDGGALWRLRAFGATCTLAKTQLKSGTGTLKIRAEVKVDEDQTGDVKTGLCQGYTFVDEEVRKQKEKQRGPSKQDIEEFNEYKKRNFEKGIVWARNLENIWDWNKKRDSVRAYNMWWTRIGFSMHMLGASEVIRLLSDNGFTSWHRASSEPAKYREVRDEITSKALEAYKRGDAPYATKEKEAA